MSNTIQTPNKGLISERIQINNQQKSRNKQLFSYQTLKVSARLRENSKIIGIINSHRIERSRSRRKQHLQYLNSLHEPKTSNKKKVLIQIIEKLDSALNQASNESPQTHSNSFHEEFTNKEDLNETQEEQEHRNLQIKLKLFESSLKQIRQNHKQAQSDIQGLKNYNQLRQLNLEDQNNEGEKMGKKLQQLLQKQDEEIEKKERKEREKRYENELKVTYGIKNGYLYKNYLKPRGKI